MSKGFLWLAALVVLVGCSKAYEPVEIPNHVQEEEDHWLFKDESDQIQFVSGPETTIRADFGGTRSHIEMNESESYAASVWTAGDSFTMYWYDETNKWSGARFTTEEGGASAAFSTGHIVSSPAPYFVVYPSAERPLGNSSTDEKRLIGVNLPAEQTAVPGGFSEGLAIAYANTSSATDNLHFQSQVSLVRFRMMGDVVSQVRTVTIVGTNPLAGDAIIAVDPTDGSGVLTQDRRFTGDVHSNTVTLSGPFVAKQDYYIVLYPGTQSVFQMIFADENGNSTTKVASEFTFPRSRISDFGTIDLGEAFTDGSFDPTPVQYMTASAGAPKPVTLAVIPEGFTAKEMPLYEMLAQSGIDALMATEPFKSYKAYFNVWILKVASDESGASITDGNGTITTMRKSYFGSKWGEDSYSDMIADEDKVYGFVSENCPDIQQNVHSIFEVPILMIINDSRYGGICHVISNGKGYGMVPYTDGGGSLSWAYPDYEASTNQPLPTPVTDDVLRDYSHQTTEAEIAALGRNVGDWRNTLVHEFGGHCFGRLGDEYWPKSSLTYESGPIQGQEGWTVPFNLNLSSDPASVLWQTDLLDYPLEALVARDPGYERIGVYQGGGTKMFGRWRSEKISCMIDNRYYFSTWQRLLIVERIMTLSGSTFNKDSFWEKDVATDPVRDVISSKVMGEHPLQVREMPLLPPPVLHEN